MADQDLIDPRIDATTTVIWKKLKDSDLATPVEQVLLHNLAEVMKGQQRLTERVEKLAVAFERLANSQKLSKNSEGTSKSTNTADAADKEGDDAMASGGSAAAKALKNLMQKCPDELSNLYDDFIKATKKKVYQTRQEKAALDALAFVAFAVKTFEDLGQDIDTTEEENENTIEALTWLKELNEDLSRDLYAKLGKNKVVRDKAAKGKGKAAETGDKDPVITRTGRRHRPNIESFVDDPAAGSNVRTKRHKVVESNIAEAEEEYEEEPEARRSTRRRHKVVESDSDTDGEGGLRMQGADEGGDREDDEDLLVTGVHRENDDEDDLYDAN